MNIELQQIGLAAAAFTFAVGGGLGILAGFAGGWADALISFLIQVLLAIPQLPVMIVIGAFLGQSTWNLVWIIAAFSWAPVARQMRAKTISIRRRDYVQMARLYGGGTWYLIRTHIGHELWPLLTINALAVADCLEQRGIAVRVQTAIEMKSIAEPYIRARAVRHLEKGRVVIFGCGTGNPFFSTDTGAVLRASEIDADIILLAKNVDGVYSADPAQDPAAIRYESLTYDQVLAQHLQATDTTAMTLAMDNHMPIVVFELKDPRNILRVIQGEKIGTIIKED